MGFFSKTYEVKPNTTGFLYRDHAFEKKFAPGYYEVSDHKNRTTLYLLPNTAKLVQIINQEVLTKDNVALRFSFNFSYRIVDGQKFLNSFALDREVPFILIEAEQRLYNIVQIDLRNRIADMESETLNENRATLSEFKTESMEKSVNEFGVTLELAQLKDLTFPKAIQDLFAKHLEAKIKSKSELENARTAVATARALKNASELMKGDENIRFMQLLETITKIAEKGKHTFMLGDLQELLQKKG